ncbi:MAG: KpsF/GutQ family sugar-phosphate isomerase [Acidobacteriota bacterium]
MARSVGPELDRAVDLCLHCGGRVVLTGIGKSGLVCRKISATLASTGTPSFYLHPADALHGDLGMLRENDVVIAVSHSGETSEILRLVPAMKRLGLPLVAITGREHGKLSRYADVVLHVPVRTEADPFGYIPTASTTGAIAMGDALAVATLVARGFREEDFAKNHPGGALGRGFLTVRELMHTGDRVPKVTPRMLMREAIRVMSAKRFGMTAVVDGDDRLLGIITDGDLRRMMGNGRSLLSRRAGSCMTASPKTIAADELAATALHLLEEHHITSLLVTGDDGRLAGVLHLHDLWKTELF